MDSFWKSGPDYFDRQGNEISMEEWAESFELGHDNRIVKFSRHKERGREFVLSTVWLGLNHQYGNGPPLIFETMAFEIVPKSWNSVMGEKDFGGMYQDRYSTEEEAIKGHNPWNAVTRYWSDPIQLFFKAWANFFE